MGDMRRYSLDRLAAPGSVEKPMAPPEATPTDQPARATESYGPLGDALVAARHDPELH